MSRPARKRSILPFERPIPAGGAWTITLGPSRSVVTLRLEFPCLESRPHLVIESGGKLVPIDWGDPEAEPPQLVSLAPLTRRRERGPA